MCRMSGRLYCTFNIFNAFGNSKHKHSSNTKVNKECKQLLYIMVDKVETANFTAELINDDYEHTDSSLIYVLENVLMPEPSGYDLEDYNVLSDKYNSLLVNPCSCSAQDNCSNCHGENYVWNYDNSNAAELVLNTLDNRDLIYECSAICKCQDRHCNNRLVQFGPRKNLRIIDSQRFQSKGLITTAKIPKGAFICEYAGELLTIAEARERLKINTSSCKMNYILCMKELAADATEQSNENSHITIIDPSRIGNIGRYLNHSCAPNCHIISVRVDCILPKIAIFANRDISINEELCFHYGDGNSKLQKQFSATPCLCGSQDCDKFLPSIEV